MNFLEKYNPHYITMSKTTNEKNIKILFKVFESPVRKTLYLFIHMCLTNDESISDQIINENNNKIVILENFIKNLTVDKLPVVVKNKKILKPKIKRKKGLVLKTNISVEERIKTL